MTWFYKGLYAEEVIRRFFLKGLDWAPLIEAKARWLKRPFEEDEFNAIWKMDKENEPCHDGFKVDFL